MLRSAMHMLRRESSSVDESTTTLAVFGDVERENVERRVGGPETLDGWRGVGMQQQSEGGIVSAGARHTAQQYAWQCLSGVQQCGLSRGFDLHSGGGADRSQSRTHSRKALSHLHHRSQEVNFSLMVVQVVVWVEVVEVVAL